MSEWRDISTAPRDGTTVLLFDEGIALGCYDADLDEWWDWSDLELYPTHWMPLPDPPQ